MIGRVLVRASEWFGLVRSFVLYWRPGRQRGLRRLYSFFVTRGDLVFDIGAHLGDRTIAFAALGARVIAVEPQPRMARWLRRIVASNKGITVRTEAIGALSGTGKLAISRRTPTMSTLSTGWRDAIHKSNPLARKVRWEDEIEVSVVTLDSLIKTYGLPKFCKIDVEGYESEVLAGLNQPVAGLSIEFVHGGLELAVACVRRIQELGSYRFNVVFGEQRNFSFDVWATADAMSDWLVAGKGGASSGDMYARLESLPPLVDLSLTDEKSAERGRG